MLSKQKGTKKMAFSWYVRIFGGDPNDPNSYTLYGSTPPLCRGICKICAIYAEDDGFGHPIYRFCITSRNDYCSKYMH